MTTTFFVALNNMESFIAHSRTYARARIASHVMGMSQSGVLHVGEMHATGDAGSMYLVGGCTHGERMHRYETLGDVGPLRAHSV